MVIGAAYRQHEGKKNKHRQLTECINRFKCMVKDSPAAFSISMCNVFYKQLILPGTSSYPGMSSPLTCWEHTYYDDREKEQRPLQARSLSVSAVLCFLSEQQTQEATMKINHGICHLWKQHSKDRHRNGRHVYFGFIDSVIRHTECGGHL
jgi:hypothetical protein